MHNKAFFILRLLGPPAEQMQRYAKVADYYYAECCWRRVRLREQSILDIRCFCHVLVKFNEDDGVANKDSTGH